MAYQMKSSPAKLKVALQLGGKVLSKAYNIITGTSKVTKNLKTVNRTKSKSYRYNEPQRGARNADGTRR